MKRLVFVIFILFSTAGYGQTSEPPVYYLNGELIHLEEVFIYPQRIDSIAVENKTKNGEVFIFTKNREFSYNQSNNFFSKFLILPKDGKLAGINCV